MAFGLILQLTHTGLTSESILITDVNDGIDALHSFKKAGPIYVGVAATVQLVYTGDVALSFEIGCIRSYITRGFFTASFAPGSTLLPALACVSVEDEGVSVDPIASVLNFIGTDVTVAPGVAGTVDITIAPNPALYLLGVATLADRDAIAAGDRVASRSLVYVRQVDQFFILIGGIANANWVWIDMGRKLNNATGYISTMYVNPATGSDVNGDGTSGLPYQTINRALAMVGFSANNTLTNIEIQSGTAIMPAVQDNQNWINVKGPTPTNSDTGTISTVVSWASSAELVLDLTLGLGYAANDLRGRRITWTSGPMNGQVGWGYRSDATGGGLTRVAVSQNGNTLATPVGTNTVAIQTLGATIQYGANFVLKNNTQLNFTDLNIVADTTGRIIFALSTDQIIFTGCYLTNFLRLQAGQNSGILLANSYLRNTGGSAAGMLRATSNAFFQLNGGTVVDGSGSAVNGNYILNENLSSFMYRGRVVLANMLRWELNGSGSSRGVAAKTANDGAMYLYNCTSGFIINAQTSGDGRGGFYSLPSLYGSVSSNYCVTATRGADVEIGSFSAVTSALGTNYVSANGGTSTIAMWSADGTYITGGFPVPGPSMRVRRITGPISDNILTSDDVLIVDASLGSVTLNLPLTSATPQRTLVVKRIDNTGGNTLSVAGTGGELIDGGASSPVGVMSFQRFFSDSPYTAWWVI